MAGKRTNTKKKINLNKKLVCTIVVLLLIIAVIQNWKCRKNKQRRQSRIDRKSCKCNQISRQENCRIQKQL